MCLQVRARCSPQATWEPLLTTQHMRSWSATGWVRSTLCVTLVAWCRMFSRQVILAASALLHAWRLGSKALLGHGSCFCKALCAVVDILGAKRTVCDTLVAWFQMLSRQVLLAASPLLHASYSGSKAMLGDGERFLLLARTARKDQGWKEQSTVYWWHGAGCPPDKCVLLLTFLQASTVSISGSPVR